MEVTEVLESSGVLTVIEQSGVEKSEAQLALSKFTHLFNEAAEWERKVHGLVITDASQVAEMQIARQARLALRDVRGNAEKVKKALKEDVLIRGRLIDAIYNSVVAVTKPLEKELLEKEQFVERQEQAKKEAVEKEREEQLAPYCEDMSFFNLVDMTDPAFKNLLAASKIAYETAREAERKAEEDRIAIEEAEAEEREQQRLENIRLRKEAEKREKQIAKERQATAKREDEERTARLLAEEEAKKLREEAEERQRKEDEDKALELEEAKRKSESPDRDQIADFITDMNKIEYPAVKSKDAKQAVSIAKTEIGYAIADLTAWVHGSK